MRIVLKEQADILSVQNELMNILPELQNKPYVCEIKRYREVRSKDANSYFHVLVEKIAKKLNRSAEEIKIELNLDYGTIARDEDTDVVVGFKALKGIPVSQFVKYAKPIGECVENGKVFTKYLVYKETHKLNSKEMSELIAGVVEEAKDLGIETLTPAELEMLNYEN